MKHLRVLAFLATAFSLLAACSQVQQGVAQTAQSATYTISQNRQPVGTASFQITARGGSYDSTSSVKVNMQGLEYALSKTEQLDGSMHVQHVLLSGVVNGSAVNIVGKPEAASFLLNISANGRGSTSRVDSHPNAVFLPDFDPGALQTLLALAAAQNGRDLWAIIPKQAGSVAPIQVATYADEQGTLDGKPLAVHHVIATISGAETDLFSSPDNQLLQAELSQPGFALVRKGFVLTPPKKPIAPPPDQ